MITTQNTKITHVANGSTTVFAFDFFVLEALSLRVQVEKGDFVSEKTLGVDWFFNPNSLKNNSGGAITFVAAPASGEKVVLRRQTARLQGTQFHYNTPLPSEVVEAALDRSICIQQELDDAIGGLSGLSSNEIVKLIETIQDAISLSKSGKVYLLNKTTGNFNPVSASGAGDERSLDIEEEVPAKGFPNLPPMFASADLINLGNLLYPVGTIYENATKATNPAQLLGFGQWERIGNGRVLVGVDENDRDFEKPANLGGEKEVTLTKAQLPADKLDIPAIAGSTSEGKHKHKIPGWIPAGNGGPSNPERTLASSNRDSAKNGCLDSTTSEDGEHSHKVTIPDHKSDPLGEGKPHNNMPPYITVYRWVRVA